MQSFLHRSKRAVFVLFLCSISTQLIAQNESDWTKVVIIDQLYPEYYSIYSFIPEKKKVRILDSLGTQIGKIKKKKFDYLIDQLVQQIHTSDSIAARGDRIRDPLKQYHLDSNWYKSNIVHLWDEYCLTNKIYLSEAEQNASKVALLNFEGVRKILQYPPDFNVNKQSVIDLKITTNTDMLRIRTTCYFPYMLSWYYFNSRIRLVDNKISLLIYEILSSVKIDSENTVLLSGVDFETRLIDDLYQRYLLTGVLKKL